jgi:hypothetical protein
VAEGGNGKGPVRGFPPAPGQPPPLYPPGQFAAWNRMSAARGGQVESGAGGQPPGYSQLAVSDPAADVTSTQTWQAIPDGPDGSGAWTAPRAPAAGGRGGGVPGRAELDHGGVGVADAGLDVGLGSGPDDLGPDDLGLDGRDIGAGRGDGPDGRGSHSRAGAGRGGSRAAPGTRAGGSRSAGPAGPRSGRSARKGRSSAVLAVCAVAVVAVAAVLFLVHAAQHPGTPPTADRSAAGPSSTAAPSPTPTLGQFGHIASRSADPLPLTVAQLFPGTFTVGGVVFTRTTSEPKGSCASAVIGTALQAAVGHGTCSQVIRASYLSVREKAMGTIGVLNLSTAATASHAGHAADTADFIAQLKGPGGPTRALGQGTGLEEAATKGHYLILIWAQFVNSASPKTRAQQAQLKTFMTQLFEATANLSLSNRMVSGTP